MIFNTLSITVAQRTREFATLRTVGASRRQVLGSVIVEALVIGLLASVIGLFAGLGLAVGLNELFVALNLDLPQTQTVFATRTIVVSLLVGTLVTLAAGLSPALRATRVPPIAAVREGATLPRSALSRFSPHVAAVTVVIAVAALAYALLADWRGDRQGVRRLLVTLSFSLGAEVDAAPVFGDLGEIVAMRYFPDMAAGGSGRPLVHDLVTMDVTGFDAGRAHEGEGTIELGGTAFDEMQFFQPVRMLEAHYLTGLTQTNLGLVVIHDYLER